MSFSMFFISFLPKCLFHVYLFIMFIFIVEFYFLKSFIKPLCFIHALHVSMSCYCISGPVCTSSILYQQNENNTDNLWNILSHLFIHVNNNFQVVLCLVSAHVRPSTLFKNQIKFAVCTVCVCLVWTLLTGGPREQKHLCRVAGLLYWNEIWVQERGEMCTDHSGQNHRLEFCKRSETQFIHVSCKPADAQINDLQSYTAVPFYIWQYNVSMIWIFKLHLTLHGCESTACALVFIWIEIEWKQSQNCLDQQCVNYEWWKY